MEILANESNFKNLINDDLVLVDFFATWCGPCRMLAPVLTELANDRPDFKIVKVDVDEAQSLSREYGVMNVPTLMIFKRGNLIAKKSGFMPKELILKWIEENR